MSVRDGIASLPWPTGKKCGNESRAGRTYRAFSSNPARNHPDNGLGVNFLFKPVAPFYISTGFQDAQGQATTTGFGTFGEGDCFYGVEVGMAPKIQGYGQGNYRLTFEYTDPIDQLGKPDEKCIGISLDQEIGGGVIPFFRYTWTQGNVTNVKYLVATGFGFSGPLGRTNDFAGIAGSWGRAATDGHQS
jgi:Carbohydrate-selective porin, OprB family